jgi:soluble lytic murein transglycosylase-like protein
MQRVMRMNKCLFLGVMAVLALCIKDTYADQTKDRLKSLSCAGELGKARSESLSVPVVEREREFHQAISEAASRHQVDAALIKAIIMAESRFNPKAISRCGAQGLMQLMPKTAEALGVEDTFDPEQNVDAGVRYFGNLKAMYKGDIELALAAYNAGIMKVKRYHGIPPYAATREYIKMVIGYYRLFQRHEGEKRHKKER